MVANHPCNNLQDALMFVGEIVGAQTVKTDNRQNFIAVNYRYRNFTANGLGNRAVELFFITAFMTIIKNLRVSRGRGEAGEAALSGGELLAADANGRNVFFQPLLVFCTDQIPLVVFHQ